MVRRNSISTSVDKLVALISEFGSLTFRKAARKLAVPISTIEEWAKVLDKADIIDIDYRLLNPVMVKKKLSKEERKHEIDSFKQDKDSFDDKLESAKSYFNELDKKIEFVSKIFKSMDGVLFSKISDVDKELKLLEKEEVKKELLDKRIINSKEKTLSRIHDIESHLTEEKDKFDSFFKKAKLKLKQEEGDLFKSKSFLAKLKSDEKELKLKLKEVQTESTSIQQEVDSRLALLNEAETHMESILKTHNNLKVELDSEHKSLDNMIKENELQEKSISKLQAHIFRKIDRAEARIKKKEADAKSLPDYFKKVIRNKKEITDTINLISHEEIELKAEIKKLNISAKKLESKLGEADYTKEMLKLNSEIDKITAKRIFFKNKITKLINLFQKN